MCEYSKSTIQNLISNSDWKMTALKCACKFLQLLQKICIKEKNSYNGKNFNRPTTLKKFNYVIKNVQKNKQTFL